jgi:hypothetical protein
LIFWGIGFVSLEIEREFKRFKENEEKLLNIAKSA